VDLYEYRGEGETCRVNATVIEKQLDVKEINEVSTLYY
jgi:hypothetical protein